MQIASNVPLAVAAQSTQPRDAVVVAKDRVQVGAAVADSLQPSSMYSQMAILASRPTFRFRRRGAASFTFGIGSTSGEPPPGRSSRT